MRRESRRSPLRRNTVQLGFAGTPSREAPNAAAVSARPCRRLSRRRTLPAIAAGLVLLTGCGESSPRSTATETSTPEADAEAVRFEDAQSGVCEAAAAAASDVEAAEAIFFDRAHDSLHELAAALGDTDRVSAARLLEAKQDVEAELDGAARREIVRDDLVALAAVTGGALDVLGIERAECEP